MVGEGASVAEAEVQALVRDLTRPLARWRWMLQTLSLWAWPLATLCLLLYFPWHFLLWKQALGVNLVTLLISLGAAWRWDARLASLFGLLVRPWGLSRMLGLNTKIFQGLVALGPRPQVLAVLMRALGDRRWRVREAAARALGEMGSAAATEEVVAALVRALGDVRWWVREAAAEVLGKMGSSAATEEAVAALVRALGDRRGRVREAAVKALGAVSPGIRTLSLARRVARALWWRLTDWFRSVRNAAYEALEPVVTRLTELQVAGLPPLDPLHPPTPPRWRNAIARGLRWIVWGTVLVSILLATLLIDSVRQVLDERLRSWIQKLTTPKLVIFILVLGVLAALLQVLRQRLERS